MIILEALINFIAELIALVFEVNLGFNWKKLKSEDRYIILKS